MRAESFHKALHQARHGSKEALGILLEDARRPLYRMAHHYIEGRLQTKGSASDLVQDTLLKALGELPHFQGNSPAELHAWLKRILVNKIHNFQRWYEATGKRELRRETSLGRAMTGEECDASPSQQAVRQERVRTLQEALARLPNHYRQALVLRMWEKRSFEAIGRMEGFSAEAARKLCSRAMKKLAHELQGAAITFRRERGTEKPSAT